MRCPQARKLFGAYWDDELTQAEREWLETHFSSCSTCRSAYEDLARTLELVSSLPRAEVEPSFADRVLAKARRAVAEPDRVPAVAPRWIPITAAAALLAVLAAAGFQWLGSTRSPGRSEGGLAARATIRQPALAASGEPATWPGAGGRGSDARLASGAAAIPDSIFDHSDDVEFILDPVTLRKGRAHTVVRVPQDGRRGEQAVITF